MITKSKTRVRKGREVEKREGYKRARRTEEMQWDLEKGRARLEKGRKRRRMRKSLQHADVTSCFYSASSSDFFLQPHPAPPPAPPSWTWQVWTDNRALSGLYKGHFVFRAA